MDEPRFVGTDEVWARLEPHLPGKKSDSGVTGKDNRLFLEAVLWRVRTGLPWRDLPTGSGNWNSVFRRFRRWAKGGVSECLFKEMRGEPDFEYALIDGTIVQAHQKASGAKGRLGLRPSGARAAGRRPRSWPRPVRSGTCSTLFSCAAKPTT